uniref:Xanthomonadin biosynthesis-related protein n=1 Tax=Xanthomonas campestris pv. campestris TaxID=340 RepID=Q5BMT5_XANCE|nr:xanthomonadin biosynthesis-related protein [Xanthomonas campestris pv. campestris]
MAAKVGWCNPAPQHCRLDRVCHSLRDGACLSDAAARDAAEANCNERSAGTTCQGEAPNLPQPATVMTAVRSQPHVRLRTHRSSNHQRICSTTA